MSRLGCGIGLLALMMGAACGRRAERDQHGRPQGPGAGLRSFQHDGWQGGARLQLHRHRRNSDRRHSPIHPAAVCRTTAAGFARRLYYRRQSRPARGRIRHNPGRRLCGARALSRSRALHQRLERRGRRDRLRQLDIGIGFERRQIFLRQRHDKRQKAGLRRGHGHLQRRSTARPIHSASPMAGPAGTPGADKYGNSRPFQTEPTTRANRGAGLFQCSRLATKSTTAARS